MAWTLNHVDDIGYVAAALISAGTKLQAVEEAMRRENYLNIYLQMTSAREYADAARKLGNDAELHFENQLHCSRRGGTPIWQARQAKSAYNKALKDAKQNLEQSGLAKKAIKKSAKKKAPKRPKRQ